MEPLRSVLRCSFYCIDFYFYFILYSLAMPIGMAKVSHLLFIGTLLLNNYTVFADATQAPAEALAQSDSKCCAFAAGRP
jgi:hypothetical protein